MQKNINTSVRFDSNTKNMLKDITQFDKRSQTQEIYWLIERRYNEISKLRHIIKCTPDELLLWLRAYKEEFMDNYRNRFHKLYLYGSYARGDYTEDSDVDLALILDNVDEAFLKKQQDYLAKMDTAFFDRYEFLSKTLVYGKDTFYKRVQFVPYYSNILKEGIEI